MTQQGTGENIVEVKPTFNIYTALLFLSIVALGVGAGYVIYYLYSPMPLGYGYEKFDDLWVSPEKQKETLDEKLGPTYDVKLARQVLEGQTLDKQSKQELRKFIERYLVDKGTGLSETPAKAEQKVKDALRKEERKKREAEEAAKKEN
jgi:hypothetical protein